MKKKLIILGLILLYIISCMGVWYMTKWNYENIWKTQSPGIEDIIITLMPGCNTLYCIWWLNDHYSGLFNIDVNKFFDIKRE